MKINVNYNLSRRENIIFTLTASIGVNAPNRDMLSTPSGLVIITAEPDSLSSTIIIRIFHPIIISMLCSVKKLLDMEKW